MPTQSPNSIALPIPRRHSPLLTNASYGQDLNPLSLSDTLSSKANSPLSYLTHDISRINDDYAPPAPPPPSPVNFPAESWSPSTCGVSR